MRRRRTRPTLAEIVIVSGLPRSGTSMLMQMLKAGGLPILTDEKREADADNLRGYLEYGRPSARTSPAATGSRMLAARR